MHDSVRSESLVRGQVGPVAIYQGFQFPVVDYRWRVRRQASGRERFPEFRMGWVFIGIEERDIRAFLFRLFVLRRRREGYLFRRRQPCFYNLPVERSADPDSAETWRAFYLVLTVRYQCVKTRIWLSDSQNRAQWWRKPSIFCKGDIPAQLLLSFNQPGKRKSFSVHYDFVSWNLSQFTIPTIAQSTGEIFWKNSFCTLVFFMVPMWKFSMAVYHIYFFFTFEKQDRFGKCQ